MTVTLTSVVHYRALTRGAPAFSAVLVIMGVPVAMVSAHGLTRECVFSPPLDRHRRLQIAELIGGHLEEWCFDQAERSDLMLSLRRRLRRKVVWITGQGELWDRPLVAKPLKAIAESIITSDANAVVLNVLPIDDAIVLYEAAIARYRARQPARV